MADLSAIVETIVSGLAGGAASGATSILAWARDIRKRLATLEEKVGSSTDPKTGLHQSVVLLEELLKRLKRDIEGWEDDPPEWAKRLVSRTRATSSMGLDHLLEVETRLDQKIRTFNERVKSVEEELDDATTKLKRIEADFADFNRLLTREEYERDAKAKSEEILRIRESLATANGLLRGVMAAMGIVDEPKKDPARTR